MNDSAVHVDLVPTMLDMMGLAQTPTQMDGRSWLGLVQKTQHNSETFGTRTFMVEYSGGGDPEASRLSAGPMCTAVGSDENSIDGHCSCTVGAAGGPVHDQSPCDGGNNTYACIRTLGPAENSIFCVFDDSESEILAQPAPVSMN